MPLDPQAQAVIDAVNALGLPAVWEVSPESLLSTRRELTRPPGLALQGLRWPPSRTAASPAPMATFPSASTRRRATAPFPSWSGITAAAG